MGGSGGTAVWAALEVARAIRRRRHRPDPDPRRRPLLPVEVLRRQLHARVRLPRARGARRRPSPRCCATPAASTPSCRELVTIEASHKVGEAIELMQRYSISQLPVVRADPADSLADVVGSLQERGLLDRVFKNPDALNEGVAQAMQPPLHVIDADRVDRPRVRRPDRRQPGRGRRRGRPAGGHADPLRPARVPRPPAKRRVSRTVSTAELRRRAVAAQGYAARTRRGRPAEVEAAIDRLGCVQLDSISAVERSHRITLAGRVGSYPRGTVSKLLGQGRIFEYWAHEACLIPIGDWPLWRRRMEERRSHHWFGPVIDARPGAGRPRAVGDPRTRAARLARLRGSAQRRHVGLEAGQADAGRAVDGGRPGRVRPQRLPAPVRPARAGDPGRDAGRADAQRGRVPARARRCGRCAPAACSPSTASSSTTACAAVPPGSGRTSTRWWRTGVLERLEVADGGPPVLVATGPQPAGSATAAGAAVAVRQPAVGPAVRGPRARLRAPDRGLQAASRSGATATTCCRSCWATASSPGWTSAATARAGVLRVLAHHPEPGCAGAPATRPASSAPWNGWPRPSGSSRCSAPTWAPNRRPWSLRPAEPISLAADAVRHPRHPRRPGSGSLHRRGDGADLPDLDLRAGGGRASSRTATTTRAPPTPPAARWRPAWPRWRARSTASPSPAAWPRPPP